VSITDLSQRELLDLHKIMCKLLKLLKTKFKTQDFNIGINEGKLAGRTIHHLHIHVIPRYKNDVEDPTGGIRNILPEGNYLKEWKK